MKKTFNTLICLLALLAGSFLSASAQTYEYPFLVGELVAAEVQGIQGAILITGGQQL